MCWGKDNLSCNNSILLISADDFLGSHLTKKLARNDYIIKVSRKYNLFYLWGWLNHFLKDVKGDFEVVAYGEFCLHKFLRKIVMIFKSNLNYLINK